MNARSVKMKMFDKKLKFWIENYGQTIDEATTLTVSQYGDEDDLKWAAEQYAQYFHVERNGWECDWPIVFSVGDEKYNFLGKVSVDRESIPHFYGKVQREV